MPINPRDERYLRYFNIANPQTLADSHLAVLGVGAVGRQIALQLAAMGVGSVDLIDFDKVEPANMGSQGYWPKDVGQYKVTATARMMKNISPDMSVRTTTKKFTFTPLGMNLLDAVFCCVDNMEARQNLIDPAMTPDSAGGPPAKKVIDTRMSATVIQTYVIDDGNRATYAKTLFTDQESFQEPCGSQATIYAATLAASLAVNAWVQSLQRRSPLPFAQVNLDAMVLSPVPGLSELEHARPDFSRRNCSSQESQETETSTH